MTNTSANTFSRRFLLSAAAIGIGAGAWLPLSSVAQPAWPNRPIKLIVPFAPGGSNDIIARLLASKLSARLGQPVVVDNKAGGGGTIGTEFVAKSPADGYNLLFASASITSNAASGKKLAYDPVKDLQPIGTIAATPFLVVVSNELKVRTLADLIAMAQARPGSINYGSAGIGGMNHLGTELFAAAAKVQLTHVPYKGIGPAFTDVMGGNLQMVLPSVASAIPHVQGGKLRGLAVTSASRSPLAPDIPTAAEAGLPGFSLEVWFGLLGPAKLPPAVVKRLNAELNAVLALPEVKDVLTREGAESRAGTPEALGELIRSELDRWRRLIREHNIPVE